MVPTLTRRGFVIAGGALVVTVVATRAGFMALAPKDATDANGQSKLPTELVPIASWLEIRSDNTILVRTGRAEIGTGMSGFYQQVVA